MLWFWECLVSVCLVFEVLSVEMRFPVLVECGAFRVFFSVFRNRFGVGVGCACVMWLVGLWLV